METNQNLDIVGSYYSNLSESWKFTLLNGFWNVGFEIANEFNPFFCISSLIGNDLFASRVSQKLSIARRRSSVSAMARKKIMIVEFVRQTWQTWRPKFQPAIGQVSY